MLRAEAVPDRKAVDRFGNPQRYILRVVDPPQYRGLIAFPLDFEPQPGGVYLVEPAVVAERYAKVRLHRCRDFELVDRTLRHFVFRCRACGRIKLEPLPGSAVEVIERFERHLRQRAERHWALSMLPGLRAQLTREIESVRRRAGDTLTWWAVEERKPVEAERIYECRQYRRVAGCAEGDRGQCDPVYETVYGVVEDGELLRVCERRSMPTVDALIAEALHAQLQERLRELEGEFDRVDYGYGPTPII